MTATFLLGGLERTHKRAPCVCPTNQEVVGSNPAGRARFLKHLVSPPRRLIVWGGPFFLLIAAPQPPIGYGTAATTMTSTSIPGRQKSDVRQARTGGFVGSTHWFQTEL